MILVLSAVSAGCSVLEAWRSVGGDDRWVSLGEGCSSADDGPVMSECEVPRPGVVDSVRAGHWLDPSG